jgi:succinate dehydrogenase / fumarate reductase cytochrome b subunit
MPADTRPVYLDLLRIRILPGAVTSILHRISGVLLVMAIPVLVYVLQLSLAGEASFAAARALLALAVVKLVGIVLLWALLHHLLAGIRYLLMDVDVGVDLPVARSAAWVVTIGAAVLTGVIVIVGTLL